VNSKLEKLEKRKYYSILDIYRHRILDIQDIWISWISRYPGYPGSGPVRVRSSYSELEKLENLFFSSSYSELRSGSGSGSGVRTPNLKKLKKKLEKFFQVWNSQTPHTVPGLQNLVNSKLEKLEKRKYYSILEIYRHRILDIPDREIPASRRLRDLASRRLREPAARRLRSQPSAPERSHTATELRPKGGGRPRSGRSEHSKAVEPVAERRVASVCERRHSSASDSTALLSPPPLRRREDRYGPGRGGGLGGRGNGEPRLLGSKPRGV